MTYFRTRRHERDHEDGSDIDRPDEPTAEEIEHDPFSFESVCRVVGQTDRLLRLRNRMLERSAALAEAVDADGLTRADRIADGEMTPADAEWLAGQAEEQGEDR